MTLALLIVVDILNVYYSNICKRYFIICSWYLSTNYVTLFIKIYDDFFTNWKVSVYIIQDLQQMYRE